LKQRPRTYSARAAKRKKEKEPRKNQENKRGGVRKKMKRRFTKKKVGDLPQSTANQTRLETQKLHPIHQRPGKKWNAEHKALSKKKNRKVTENTGEHVLNGLGQGRNEHARKK